MSLTERVAQWRWFRLTAGLLVGSALFVLGVIYLNMTRQSDQPGFVAVGGTHGYAGRALALRLSARGLKSNEAFPVQVDGVTVDGQEVAFTASQADPRIVTLELPSALAGDAATLGMAVVSDGLERVLEHRIEVRQPVATATVKTRASDKRVSASGKTRIDVIPEASVLAMGMRNRVLIRIRDDRGRPVKGAPVWVTHPRLLVPAGRQRYTSDAMGLVEVVVQANAPSVDLKVEVMPPGKALEEILEPLRPRGRQMLLTTERPVFRPGEPIEATLRTWRPRTPIHCDLIEDGAILWSGVVSTGPSRTTEVKPPVGCVGLCHLQCAGHPWEPGDQFASIPVVVTAEGTLTALAGLVRDRGVLHTNSLKVAPGADVDRTARYLLTFLQEDAQSPKLWFNTQKDDQAARDEVARSGKQKVLIAIGLVFILIIFVVADVLIRNTAAQRRRMREFAAETLGEDELALTDSIPESLREGHAERGLARTRGVLLLVAMGGALVANLVAIVWLLGLVGEI